MDPHRGKAIGFFKATGTTGTTTQAGVASKKHTVTHISGSSDAAGVVTLESPLGTVLWQKRFGAAFTFSETLPPGEYECPVNTDAVLKVSAGTNKELNLAGYDIPG